MLPKDDPHWKSVYHYFCRWHDDGTWQRIHDTLRAAVRRKANRHKYPTAGWLDRQHVKTAARPGVRGYDAGKQINGRKRHILVDTMGLLLAVIVTVAAVQDRDGAKLLLHRLGGACKNCGGSGLMAPIVGNCSRGVPPIVGSRYPSCSAPMTKKGL